MENADNPIAPNALEYGRKLFERECRFVAGANSLEMLPNPELTEIAFAGRSNVGSYARSTGELCFPESIAPGTGR